MEQNDVVNKLIDDHYNWLEGLLKAMDYETYNIDTIRYLYKTAMIHGYKHGYEDRKHDL